MKFTYPISCPIYYKSSLHTNFETSRPIETELRFWKILSSIPRTKCQEVGPTNVRLCKTGIEMVRRETGNCATK
jgi:hypothetical protein